MLIHHFPDIHRAHPCRNLYFLLPHAQVDSSGSYNHKEGPENIRIREGRTSHVLVFNSLFLHHVVHSKLTNKVNFI